MNRVVTDIYIKECKVFKPRAPRMPHNISPSWASGRKEATEPQSGGSKTEYSGSPLLFVNISFFVLEVLFVFIVLVIEVIVLFFLV